LLAAITGLAMASIRYVLLAFLLVVSAHAGLLVLSAHAALALEPALSQIQHYGDAGPRDAPWMRVHLCNGISKHTRTICCGTNPPAWCGRPDDASASNTAEDDAAPRGELVPVGGEKTTNDVMFLFRDPMFYVCMVTSVTVIYLVALAGSGRDRQPRESSL
jgi:hypothetical protein